MTRPARRGFTLTELLLVLLIVGTVAAIGTPLFSSAARQGYVQSAADAVADEVARAHGIAMARQRCVRVSLDESWVRVFVDDAAVRCADAEQWRELHSRSLRGFTLSALSVEIDKAPVRQLSFDPLGRLLGPPALGQAVEARVTAYGEGVLARQVEVTSRGGVRVLGSPK